MSRTPEQRLARLRKAMDEFGDILTALRWYTGESTSAMCRNLGVSRTSVQIMGRYTNGRREESTRRALEAGLGLPPYSLDTLLDARED